MTDVTKITIAAVDQASEVFGRVQSSVERMHASYAKLAGLITAGAGVGYFVNLIKGAIDAAEQIDKLSQKTGIAVQALSQLDYVFKLQGVDTDTFARGLKTLSTRMLEAQDSTSKAGKILNALGVDIKGGPQAALEQLASKFVDLEDGTTKTALAVELFGKNGMALIPTLNQGADGIRRAREEAQQLGLAYGPDFAKAASQFNDNLKAVEAHSTALGISLANQLSPYLKEVIGAMKQATLEGASFIRVMQIAGAGVLVSLFSDQALSAPQKMAKEMAKVQDQIASYQATIASAANDPRVQGALFEQLNPKIVALQQRLGELRAAYQQSTGAEQQGLPVDDEKAKRIKALEEQIRSLLGGGGSANSFFDQHMASAAAALAQATEIAAGATGKLTASEKAWLEIREKPEFKNMPATEQKLLEAKLKAAAAQERYNKTTTDAATAQKELLAIDEQTLAEIAAFTKAGDDRILALQDEIDRYQLETDALGKNNLQRELEYLDYKRKLALRGPLDDAQRAAINAKYDEMKAIAAVRDARTKDFDEQVGMWTDLADRGAQFFGELATSGKRAIDILRTELKNFLRDMVAMFAKRWILQLGATALGGTAAGTALGNTAATTGTGTLGSAFGSAAGSYLGYAGAGLTTGGSFASGFSAGAAGIGGTEFTGMAAMGQTVGAVYGGITDILAMIPVWGWIAAAVIAIAVYLGGKGGGPKVGGSYLGGFGPQGQFLGDLTGTVDRSQRLQDETQADSFAGKLVMGMNSSFQQALQSLGGTSAGVQFGIGFNKDPQGNAPSMVSSLVRDASGKEIFVQSNRDVGRDDAAVQAEITLQSQRAILAALQASTLPKEIANILNSISAQTATSDQINQAMAAAQEMAGVIKALGQLNIKGLDATSLKAMALAGETITQTLQRVAGEWTSFHDAFMTDSEKFAAARAQIASTFDALNIAVPTTNQQFLDIVDGLDLSTEAGRNMFNAMMQIAPAFQTVTNAATTAIAQLYNTAASLSGSFGQQYAKANLDMAAQAWLSRVPGAAANGWTVDSVINEIGGLVGGGTSNNPGGFSDALKFVQGLGPDAVNAFQALLDAYSAWKNTANNSSVVNTAINSIGSLGSAASSAASALATAQDGIRTWLSNTLLSPQLSTLDPQQQLNFAHDQYVENLLKAQGGDVDALSKFTSMADAYLQQARSFFASGSDYQAIFAGVTGQAAGLAGLADASRPLTAADFKSGVNALVKALNNLQVTMAIGRTDIMQVSSDTGAAIQQTNTQLAQAINDGALGFK